MSKKKVIEDLDTLLDLLKSNFSESCVSSYDSLNEFDKISRNHAPVKTAKNEQAKGGSLSSDEFSTETNSNLFELDTLLQELSSAKFFGKFDESIHLNNNDEAQISNHNSTCSDELSDKLDSSVATEELDTLMLSLTRLGASTPSKNNLMIPDPIHPPVSLSVGAELFSCSTLSLLVPQKMKLDDLMLDWDDKMEMDGIKVDSKGTCAACGKMIVGDVISAMGKMWHSQHFVCVHCNVPIGDNKFLEKSGNFYCEKDFQTLFSPKCVACDGPILDTCVTGINKTWHPEHFICFYCKKQLVDSDGFHEHNNQIYCRKDYYGLVAPRCGKCKQPIVENFLSTMNKFWHISCFVCFDCGETVGADNVYEVDGYPYCCQHYHARKGSLCHACRHPIVGPCVSAMMKKFHPEHFTCSFCQGRLSRGIFKEHAEKPYCRHCYRRLFS